MNIQIKRVHENAVIPTYAHGSNNDACFDLIAVSREIVDNKDHGYISYGTGLQMAIPEGFVGLLFPRSSISTTGMILANAVGVIDPAYRGEVSVRFKWIKDSKMYEIGDRVCQMMIIPREAVAFEEFTGDWEETARNENGYGSSGN